MRRLLLPVLIAVSLAMFPACSKKVSGPHATVSLRDGTAVAGTVVGTSPSQITLVGDDNTTRTIAMTDVRSIDYGEAPPEAQAPGQPGSLPSATVPRQQAHAPRYHPEESAIQTRTYLLPVGTEVAVRTDDTIDSGKAVPDQTYAAEVYRDVLDQSGAVVIPHGSNALIVIRSASGGRVTGTSDLVLDLQSVSIDGRLYQPSTTDLAQTGRAGLGKNKRTGEFAGGGAIIGAVIGAIAGGGKGAAIGAGAGAAAGAGAQVATKGGAIRVPAETILTFKLDRPLRVSPAQ
jgi:hypothetical protein